MQPRIAALSPRAIPTGTMRWHWGRSMEGMNRAQLALGSLVVLGFLALLVGAVAFANL
jgi:hypothetical protein